MAAGEPLLDRHGIEEAFRRLGRRLSSRGVVADVHVVGGAAMVLAYDARRATRDIDAVFRPHGVVLDEAQRVADELGLPRYWLNDQASVYVSAVADTQAVRVFDEPGLRVSAACSSRTSSPTCRSRGRVTRDRWATCSGSDDPANRSPTLVEGG